MKKSILFLLFAGLCFVAYPQCQKSQSSCSSKSSCHKDKDKNKDKAKDKQKAKNKKYKHSHTKERFTFSMGPSANYTTDPVAAISDGKGGFITPDAGSGLQSSLVNYQGNAFVGYKFDRKGHHRANTVGVWGDFGMHSPEAVSRIVSRHNIRDELSNEKQNEFYEVEVGVMFRDWVRVSGGIGGQGYTPLGEKSQTLNYYSLTTGVNVKIFKWASWQANLSMLHGQDYEKFTFRPSTGVVVNFPFGRL